MRKRSNKSFIEIWKSMSIKEKIALILFIMLLIFTAGELDVENLRSFGRG
tara:strand:- start:149 stop:298 length:150 start_codon:yes stop_codon:yes gene_type:complete